VTDESENKGSMLPLLAGAALVIYLLTRKSTASTSASTQTMPTIVGGFPTVSGSNVSLSVKSISSAVSYTVSGGSGGGGAVSLSLTITPNQMKTSVTVSSSQGGVTSV